jgi:predicted phage terminase large subunit-like protein
VTSDGGYWTVHVVVGIDPQKRMYLLDLWRQQSSSKVWIEAYCDLVIKYKPMWWAFEKGQIVAGLEPFINQRSIDRQAWTSTDRFPTKGDKAIRSQSIRGRMELQGLYVPAAVKWLPDLRAELTAFPDGKHDDQVDALGLVGQLMDRYVPGYIPKKPDNEKWPGYVVQGDSERNDYNWKTL